MVGVIRLTGSVVVAFFVSQILHAHAHSNSNGSPKSSNGKSSSNIRTKKSKAKSSSSPDPDIDEINAVEIVKVEETSGPKSYIVVLKESDSFSTMAETARVAMDMTAQMGTRPDRVYTSALRGYSFTIGDDSFDLDELRNKPEVAYIMRDEMMFATEGPKYCPDCAGLSRVGADKVNFWAGNENNVAVAILDTGVDTDHAELPNIVDDVGCRSFVTGEDGCDDGNGHGTHVAGTACGTTTGVAPGCKIWAIKVLSSAGGGTISGIIEGLDYVASHAGEIDVVNMSLGGGGSPTSCDSNCGCQDNAFHEAVCKLINLGVVVVVAAGNDNVDATNFVPANFDDVITVSAVADSDGDPGGSGLSLRNGADPDDALASFSNYGPRVDFAAPGVDIYSTYMGGGHETISGTSMASPHVAGAAALYVAKNGLTKSRAGVLAVKDGLLRAADPQDGKRGFTGDTDGSAEPMLNVENLNRGAAPIPPPSPVPVRPLTWVRGIFYIERRINQQDRLYITIAVTPNVAGAMVSLELYKRTSGWESVGRAIGRTNNSGSTIFYLGSPIPGTVYRTAITNIQHPEYDYDESKNAQDRGYGYA